MIVMMKPHQFGVVLLCWLSAYSQVDSYIMLDGNSSFEELFTMCLNRSSEAFSCTNRCGLSQPYSQNCQCDSECLSYGDCCLDYERLCITAQNPHTLRAVSSFTVPETRLSSTSNQEDQGSIIASSEDAEDTSEDFLIPLGAVLANYPEFDLELRSSHKYFNAPDCVQIGQTDHGPRYFIMVNKCMDSAFYGSPLEQLCLASPAWDVLALLPVSVTNDTHYKNIYCAFCSGIQYKDIYFWKVAFYSIYCRGDMSETHFEEDRLFDMVGIMIKLCDYEFLPNIPPGTHFPRACSQEHKSRNRCKANNQSLKISSQQLCDKYSYPLIVNGNWYKNVHCAFCNEEFQNRSANISCSFENSLPTNEMRPLSLPVLFTFSAKDGGSLSSTGNVLSMSNSSTCNINEWFDPFTQECRTIYCPSNTLVISGVCVKDLNASNLTFDQCSTNSSFWKQKYEEKSQEMSGNQQRTSWIKVRAVSNHQSALNLILVTFRVTLKSEKVDVSIKKLKTVSSPTANITLETHNLIFEVHLTDDTSNFTNMPSAIRRAVRLLDYDSEITMSVLSVEWQNYESLSVYTDICTEAHGDVFLRVLWDIDTAHYTDDQYDMLLLHEDMFNEHQPKKLTIFTSNNREWSKFSFQCCSSPLPCRKIGFNSSEFDWDDGINGTLLHKASGITIPPDAFSLDGNGHVRVCKSVFDGLNQVNATGKSNFLNSQSYVTLAGNVVSIVSLFATLVTIFTFTELQNLPGKIISCLSISLLLANVLLLTSYPTSSQWLCLFFGVSLHYVWLSVFFWANALAIDLTRTFRVNSKRMVFRIKGNVQFLCYSLYAWLPPAIIVAIGLLIHFLTDRRIYDTSGTCWIIAGQPIITLFLIPFIFFMVINTILFIVVLFSISKTKEGIDTVTESSISIQSKALFWLALKLSFTLGITWALGLIAAMAGNQVIWYIFNVVNSLSGLGVSLSIIVNRKVAGLWMGKLNCGRGMNGEGGKERKGTRRSHSNSTKKLPNDSEI